VDEDGGVVKKQKRGESISILRSCTVLIIFLHSLTFFFFFFFPTHCSNNNLGGALGTEVSLSDAQHLQKSLDLFIAKSEHSMTHMLCLEVPILSIYHIYK